MRLSRFCFSSTVLLACTALLMIQAGAEKVSVSAKFFLRLCDAKHRGCFLGAFGVSMHSGEPGSENCKDSCVIFPAFKSRYKCGKCSPASAPTRPPVTNPGPAPAQVTAPATAPSTGTKPVTAPSTGTTPVTTPSSVLVTGAPFAAPSPGFNMTLGFDNIPAGDIQFFHKASARWERVITSDFPSFNSSGYTKIAPNCAYPEMIDDMYVCVYYTDITEPEVVGYGGPILRRTSRTTTLTGMIKLKLGLFPEGQPPSYLQSLITHELGHAMGIGVTATCPSASNTSKATLAYQNISKCLTTVPTDEGCGHFHRDCLGDEVMTPTVSRSSFISPLTLGWLEDLGYNVSYSEADPHSANQLGTHPTVECNCNRPILRTLRVASMSPRGVNSPNSDLHRKLSDEGRKMAMASGMKYLDEQAEEHAKSSVSTSGTSESEVFSPTEEAEFVGDQVVSVMYMEHGTIHTVLVRRHP